MIDSIKKINLFLKDNFKNSSNFYGSNEIIMEVLAQEYGCLCGVINLYIGNIVCGKYFGVMIDDKLYLPLQYDEPQEIEDIVKHVTNGSIATDAKVEILKPNLSTFNDKDVSELISIVKKLRREERIKSILQ